MYAVKLVHLPQWDLEFFKNLACQDSLYSMHDLCRIFLLLSSEFSIGSLGQFLI